MSFGAAVATKTFLWLVVFIYLRDQIVSGTDLRKCYIEECGGGDNRTIARKKGEVLCSSETKGVPGLACEYKCLGEKVDEDQLQCWKRYCGSFPDGFCERPQMDGIRADQCEEYLNKGRVKYYGSFCHGFKYRI